MEDKIFFDEWVGLQFTSSHISPTACRCSQKLPNNINKKAANSCTLMAALADNLKKLMQ
jgi:hypothetical protein